MNHKVQYQVILLVVAILTIFFVFPMPSWAAPQGYIQGYVMDDSDPPQAIEGALIEADGVSTTSDANGYYLLTLPEGTYTVTASRSDCNSQSVSDVTVTKNVYIDQNFTLIRELKLEAVYPALGLWGEDLEVTLTGTGFNANTRVSMYPDYMNKGVVVGSVDMDWQSYDVALSGSYAYVANHGGGLRIIDIGTSSDPEIVSTVSWGSVFGVTISGNYAYVAYDGGLLVIDISTPPNPQIIGWVLTPGTAWKVAVSGSYAYVADRLSGLQVIDISTPSSPQIIGSVDTSGEAWGVAISGNYAYVADMESGLQVIDISTPSSPQIIGSIDTPGSARSVVLSGSYAYVPDDASGLQVIDISTPSAPQIVGSVNTEGNSFDVAISGSYAYLAGYERGIEVIDISTPSSPQIIGWVGTPGNVGSVSVSGSYVYVAGSGSTGFQVFDISAPLPFHELGSVDTLDPYGGYDVTILGSYAYVADGESGLQIIDIKIPSNPQIVGAVDTPGYALYVSVSGSYAYVADEESGLQVIDINTPENPQIIGSINTPGSAVGVTVSGSYAYVADGDPGLQVIDINTPENPQIIGSINTPGSAVGITVSGSYAYIADQTQGLQVIDISTPSAPQIVGAVDTPGLQPWYVTVSDSYAYVTGHFVGYADSGLQVIDISTPENPQVIYHTNDSLIMHRYAITNLEVSGSYAYLVNFVSFFGLEVIDISTPTNPRIICTLDLPGTGADLAISGNYAYVVDGYGRFVAVPVPIEINPVAALSDTKISLTLNSPNMAARYNLLAFNNNQHHELPGAVSFTDDSNILNSKAIIVAGGGPNASGGTIWEETKLCANKAYDALILQGYEHDSIYYMSMEAGNDYVDSSSPNTFLSDLSNAINVWATNASQVLIYFVDHGQKEQFVLYADSDTSQTLSAQELDTWLDNLQNGTMNGPVTFVYDACESGSFVYNLRPPDDKERVVITGASYEPAYFLENGGNSFSFQFWDRTILNKGNLGDAFSYAKDTMQIYQSAQIEANWDFEGNTNESEDIGIAENMTIRRGGYAYIGIHPFINSISNPQILSSGTSATLWASGVIDAQSVQALIIPPDANPETADIPITDLPTIELTDPDGDHVYEGVYDGFDTEGTYVIVIKAQATEEIYSYVQGSMVSQTIYSPNMYTSVTKTSGIQNIEPDSYEQDDTYSQASIIVLNDDTPQSHNFHDVGDVDWVKFYGLSGEIYKIKASSLGITCDVVIEIYDNDGITLLAGPKNDAGSGMDEYLEWACPQHGIYYVKVGNANDNFGENTKYDLRVYRPIGPFAGFIQGTITDTVSGSTIGGVQVRTGNNGSAISLSDGSYLMVHLPGTFTVTAEGSGYYTAIYSGISVSEGGITTKDIGLVPEGTDIEPTASITLPSSGITINEGESVNFQGSITGGNAPFTYEWNFGGGAVNSDQEDPGSVTFLTEGVYTVTFTVTDDDGDSSSDTVTVTVNSESWDSDGDGTPDGTDTDDDNDGLADEEEYGPDGNDPGYDGNQDGTADSLQSNVVSFHTFNAQNYVTLEVPPGLIITDCLVLENPSPDDVPSDVEFPYGFFEFTLQGMGAGGATTVTLHCPEGSTFDTYYKLGPTPDDDSDHWYEFLYNDQTGAEINENIITLHFVDGKRGDDDLTADGIIIDAGGPGVSVGTAGEGIDFTPVDCGTGGGCFIATAAYGSPLQPHVVILRDFRDRFLLTNSIGNAFAKLYYRYSPSAADFIAEHTSLRAIVRVSLLPVVGMSWVALKIGPIPTILLILFLSIGLIGIVKCRRKKVNK